MYLEALGVVFNYIAVYLRFHYGSASTCGSHCRKPPHPLFHAERRMEAFRDTYGIRSSSAGATCRGRRITACWVVRRRPDPGIYSYSTDPDSDTEDSNHPRQEHEKVSGASLSGLTKASRSMFADHSGGVEVARRCNTVRTWAGFSQQRHGGRCLERDLTFKS